MTVRIYREVNGDRLAARVTFPGLAPGWWEADSLEALDNHFEARLKAYESDRKSRVAAQLARECGKQRALYRQATEALRAREADSEGGAA